jgi:hypothetical protein
MMKRAATTIKQDIPLPSWEDVSINHLIIQTYGRLEMKERNDFAATASLTPPAQSPSTATNT